MVRLVLTNLRYLTFEKIFLAAAAAAVLLGVRGGMAGAEYGWSTEYPIFAVLLAAAVTLLNCGRENTDGTLRNRLTLGYRRPAIFGSFLISSLICSFIIYLLFSVPFFLIAKDTVAENMSGGRYLLFWTAILCIIVLVTVGSVVLTMCIPMLPVAAVALLAAAIGFVASAEYINRALSESKYIYYSVSSPNKKDFENTDKFPVEYDEDFGWYYQTACNLNENYVDGAKREVYTTLLLANPYGQLANINSMMRWYSDVDVLKQYEELKTAKPELFEDDSEDELDEFGISEVKAAYNEVKGLVYYPVYTLAFSALLTVGGILVFRKRNIN